MEYGPFPKLISKPIPRRAIEKWLAFHRETPLRYLYGPTGSGKVTAACLHARAVQHPVAFVNVPQDGSTSSLLAALDRVLDAPIASVPDLLAAFPTGEPFELIIGDLDNADAQAREMLARLPGDVPANVTLTYLARARGVVDMVALTTKGIGAAMDRSLLAFTQAEAAEMCEALGVAYTPTDINQLIYASEGWAFAVTGAIREAAVHGRELRGALSVWQARNRRLIEELLMRSLTGLSELEAEAARRVYAGESAGTATAYQRLHDFGLLLSFSDTELRPLRAVAPISLKRDLYARIVAPPVEIPMASIEMFGQFEMTIDGRPVEWFRKRDRQIVEYLALQIDTSATRHNVIATFWPHADAQLANQSLRTACSTIRRAIAQCVGYDRVHCYFTAGRSLRLNTDHISLTSLRFRGHIRSAEEALREGNEAAAQAHYLAASRIYRGPLLDGDGPEPWISAERELYSADAGVAAECVLELRSRRPSEKRPEAAGARLLFSA